MNGFLPLLWREWRRSRTLLVVAFGSAVALVIVWQGALPWPSGMRGNLIGPYGVLPVLVSLTAWVTILVGAILIPLTAANTLAGERIDRTAEFIGPLPLNRVVRLAAKIALLAAVAFAIWEPILFVAWPRKEISVSIADMQWQHDPRIAMGMIATFTLLSTSMAWLFAAWIESPVIAAVAGLAGPVAIPWMMIAASNTIGTAWLFRIWLTPQGMPQPVAISLAAAAFAIGCVRYLWRPE